MGVLKTLTDEYFGNNIRKEDEIDISGLDVEIFSFKDNNGNYHSHGYRVNDGDEDEMAKTLKKLIERVIKKRGNECDLNDIDVSNIKQMNYSNTGVFEYSDFNGDISGWNVSGVENMCRMFYCVENFNQPIGNWDVRKVENMTAMFDGAYKFNQPIGNWDVSGVKDMSYMFAYAGSFDQDLNEWQLKDNCDTYGMFDDCPLEKHPPKWYKNKYK